MGWKTVSGPITLYTVVKMIIKRFSETGSGRSIYETIDDVDEYIEDLPVISNVTERPRGNLRRLVIIAKNLSGK